MHPDHGIIGNLRVALADLGFTTLSIQMPVLASDARPEDYRPALFAEAGARIAAAAQWLKAKGRIDEELDHRLAPRRKSPIGRVANSRAAPSRRSLAGGSASGSSTNWRPRAGGIV